MKKFIICILVSFVFISSVSAIAGEAYIQPVMGTGGIPMAPKRTDQNYPYGEVYSNYTDWKEYGKGEGPYVSSGDVPRGKYSAKTVIGMGGVKNPNNDFESITIKANIMCNEGFYFVSQEHPSYMRPFEMYLVPRASRINLGSAFGITISEQYWYGKPIKIQEGSTSIEFTFKRKGKSSVVLGKLHYAVWFDLVLCLPGDVNEKGYVDGLPLTKANDYSAKVTISMDAEKDGVLYPAQGLSLSFTGQYGFDEAQTTEDVQSTISMYIRPASLAGSLDMKAYGKRQEVADIGVLGVNNLSTAENWAGGESWLDQLLDGIDLLFKLNS